MFDAILTPVDGSELSLDAANDAIELAASHGAELHILYVIEVLPTFTKQGGSILAQDEEHPAQREYGEQLTGELADQATDAGVDVVTALKSGTPSHVITDYAKRNELDLIVMGTYGRAGVRDRLVGSTTERVLRESPISVLAVR